MERSFCPHCMSFADMSDTVCPGCGGDLRAQNGSNILPVGTTIARPGGPSYLLGLAKGQGGFGVTYIGRNLDNGKLVAVKEYFPRLLKPYRLDNLTLKPQERPDYYLQGMESFLAEARTLQSLEYLSSVVRVLDFLKANNTAYMVMEYLQGMTLQQLVDTQGPISFDELLPKMLPLLRDVQTMHAKAKFLHRDIAPDNLMLMPDQTLKLLDFGSARSMENGRSMTIMLKPGFSPLEQYMSRGQGPYTDLYGLAATIYYCITGKIPPVAPDRIFADADRQSDPLLPPSACGVRISPSQEQALMKALAVQPSARLQTVGEFLDLVDPSWWTALLEKIKSFFRRAGRRQKATQSSSGHHPSSGAS